MVKFEVRHEGLIGSEVLCEAIIVLDELYSEVLYHKTLSLYPISSNCADNVVSPSRSSTLRNLKDVGNLRVSFTYRTFERVPNSVNLEPKYLEKVKNLPLFLVSEDLLLTTALVNFVERKSHSYTANSEFFQALLNCFLTNGFGYGVEFVKKLLIREVESLESSDLLFRENSTVNGVISFLCKKYGSPYASTLLNPIIFQVIDTAVNLEIDPRRISTDKKTDHTIEDNIRNFQFICKSFVDAIIQSLDTIPL